MDKSCGIGFRRGSGGALVLVDEPSEEVDPFDRSAVILQRGGLERCLQVEASVRERCCSGEVDR
jgi:hypothetical protein